jgi:hypothetical protein
MDYIEARYRLTTLLSILKPNLRDGLPHDSVAE